MIGDQRADGFALVGVGEPWLLPGGRFGARHAGIAPAARTAKENRRADTHGSQRLAEFADAVTAKLVGVIDAKLCPPVTDDFALFAQSAGDDAHLGAASYVMRDGGAVGDGFVVRMGVYEQQPRRLLHGRTIPGTMRR